MSTPTINFTWNWNSKLFCRDFTTIRLRNDHKYQVGQTYDIQFNGKSIGQGVILQILNFKLGQLTPFMSHLDTGYSVPECKKLILTMYKHSNLNWETQQLSFILIQQRKKKVIALPDEYFTANEPAPAA